MLMANPRTYESRWWILAGVLVFGALLYILQRVLLPFALALFLAYIVLPLVNGIERRVRWPRLLIVLSLFCAGALPAALLGLRYLPPLGEAARQLLADLPRLIQQIAHRVLRGDQLTVMGHTVTADALAANISAQLNRLFTSPDAGVSAVRYGVEGAVSTVLVFVLLFYVLVSVRSFSDVVLALAPPAYSPRLQYFAPRIDQLVGRYLRGVFLVVLFQSAAAYIGFRWLAGLPYATLAAVITGILEPLPGIGPILAIVVVGGGTLLLDGVVPMLKAMAVLGLLRVTLDNVVGPVLLGWTLRLHPVLIIFAFLVSGSLFGVVGLLIALPATATIRLLIQEWDCAAPRDVPDVPEAIRPDHSLRTR